MKAVRSLCILLSFTMVLSSCSVFGGNKRGCPQGGMGAEQMMDGSKVKKQKKFKG